MYVHSSFYKIICLGVIVIASSIGCLGDAGYHDSSLAEEIVKNSLHSPDREPVSKILASTLYDIKLQIHPDLRKFTVEEKIHYTNSTGTMLTSLVLQLPGNALYLRDPGQSHLFIVKSVHVGGISVTGKLENSVLTVPLTVPLAAQQPIEIGIKYDADVPFLPPAPDLAAASLEQMLQLMTGTSSTTRNYGTFSFSSDILSLDHWYAVIPRFSNGAFDTEEPSGTGDVANFDIGNFNVEITHPKDLTIATSGTIVDETAAGESKVTRVHGAGMRDMTVMGSTRFQTVKRNVGQIAVTAYFLPEDAKHGAKLADFTVNALNTFQDSFGPYPYKTLNVVEAPLRGGAGGMEYSGLITIGKQFLGINQLTESPMIRGILERSGMKAEVSKMFEDSVEFIVAHEVAHQWWHGLVGSDAKQHPFTDESLTNYSAVLYFEKVHGRASAKKQEEGQLELTYKFYRLTSGKDTSVDRSAASFKDGTQYGAIVYSKGALLYRELRAKMGDELFFTFLKRYAQENRFGFATPDTIKSTLLSVVESAPQPVDGPTVARIFDKWSQGTNADSDIGKIRLDAMAEAFIGPDAFAGPDGEMKRMMINGLGEMLSQLQ